MPLFHRPQKGSEGLAIVQLAALMFVVTILAIVVLAATGQDTQVIERLVGPLLSAVIITGVLGAATHGQDKKLDVQTEEILKIKEQTNGVLDARIREQTKAALLELQAAEQTGAHAAPLEEPVLDDLDEEPVTNLGGDTIRP